MQVLELTLQMLPKTTEKVNLYLNVSDINFQCIYVAFINTPERRAKSSFNHYDDEYENENSFITPY